jgi:hypothetical protein
MKFVNFDLGSRKLFPEEYPMMIQLCDKLIADCLRHNMQDTKFYISIIESKEKLEKELDSINKLM